MRVRTSQGVGSVIAQIPQAGLVGVRLDAGGYVEFERDDVERLPAPSGPPCTAPAGTAVRNALSGIEGTVHAYADSGRLVGVVVDRVCVWFDAREWTIVEKGET